MHYNPAIHHRHSIRLKGYNYSQAGLYFVTMCVKNRECLFGKVADNEMILNDIGKIAMQCWAEISQHFPCAILHQYIIMPNHVHGIIELINDVQQIPQQPNDNHSRPQGTSRTVGSIIRGFKIGVTVGAKNFSPLQSIWQRNYWEHIIRNEQSYQHIANYIVNNPANWEKDKFYVGTDKEGD